MNQTRLSYNLDLSPESVWLTVTAAQAARTSIAYVQELGDFHCGKSYFTSRENLSSYLLKLCLSGKGLLEYEGETYEVKPGSVFWIDCERPQTYYTAPDSDGEWRLLWVHFNGPTCAAYYNLFMNQNGGRNLVYPENAVAIRTLLEMLMRLYQGGGSTLQDDVQASAALTRLMCSCIDAAGGSEGSKKLPIYVIEARNYIDAHYPERITLDVLAQKLSVNKFYLQKIFKQCLGLSPYEYILHTRLNRAKQLLRTTSQPIGQIAASVGFNCLSYFSPIFKKYEGLTPSAFRNVWYISDAID